MLYFLDPSSFRVIETLSVKENGRPVRRINELEYIKGYIYANIWKTSRIAVIDPSSGKVEAWLDLSDVVERAGGDNSSRTLNGIAYDAKRDRIYVTGKLWPRIYEIEILPPR
jgi:glutamine cyclotransferase